AITPLRSGALTAGTRITRRLAGRQHRLAGQLELTRRAVARVGRADDAETLLEISVERRTLGLPVWRCWSSASGPRLPTGAQPAQVIHERREMCVGGGLEIGILVAQDEAGAGAARQQVIEQCGARVAEMERAGRAWREAG